MGVGEVCNKLVSTGGGNLIPIQRDLHGGRLRAPSGGSEGHGTRQPFGSGTINLCLFCFHLFCFY
jgi:hypothetical protein